MSILTQRHPSVATTRADARARPVPAASHLLPLLVLALTLAVFSQVGTFSFVRWDDDLHVYNNPWLHPVTPTHVWHFWRTPYEGLYIPLSYTVYALLALLARRPGTLTLDPHIFHCANLVLHLLNVLLVFRLVRKCVPNVWAAAAGALLFGVHPVQVESVAWISELRGLLSGAFVLLALWHYLEFLEARSWGCFVWATAAFGLALLAKPSAVAVPLLAGLLAWGLGRPWRRSLPPLMVWAVMSLACVWASHAAQSVPPELFLPLRQRFLVAGDALTFHLAHLVWPAQLGIDYGRSPAVVLAHPWGHWTWLAPALLGGCLWAGRRRCPMLVASGAVFLGALLPVLGLLPFAFQTASTVADRYMYLAMLGPALATAWLLAHVPRRAVPLAAGLTIGVLLLLGLQGTLQASYWQNDFSLFARALAVNPRSWIADNNLGTALWELGRKEQAVALYRNSLTWNPNQENAWNNLGVAMISEGRLGEAESALRNARRLEPDSATIANNLGMVYMKQCRLPEAAQQFQAALRLDPNYTHVRKSLEEVSRALHKR